jgi:triacylglycerol esterase/lipase EstA (alpha/beta hydrolase family)
MNTKSHMRLDLKMKQPKKWRNMRDRRKATPLVDMLESREMMAADALGVFAVQQGNLSAPNQSVSQKIVVDKANFKPSQVGPIMLRLNNSLAQSDTNLGPMNLNALQNPVGRRALPSTWQTATGDGGLLARVRFGSYVVSSGYGDSNLNAGYEFQYRLAGDVDGSFSVTRDDLALIRSGMIDPSILSPEEFANADIDSSGTITARDLRLARSNIGAATEIRPLTLDAKIGDATPHNGAIVRLDSSQIVAKTNSDGASVVFTNASTGQQIGKEAGPAGDASADLALKLSSGNSVHVSAMDGFGQSRLTQILVDQRPTPTVILPGYTASLPKTFADLGDFIMQLGLPADELAVIPKWAQDQGIVNIYENVQVMLENAGYVRGVDQFIVPYDWRIPIAPNDGVADGTLSLVTAQSITQAQPQFSLGYFGNFLKNLIKTDPSVVTINLMGHSNGGLMTRSYIQSLAYGATFTENGQTYTLPKVDKAVLLAAPSMGAAMAWPVWNNDTAEFTLGSSAILRTMLLLPFGAVLGGETVTSPNGNITLATITDPVTQQPNPNLFLQLYVSSLRDLLPTYDFLYTTNGVLTNINSTPSANHLLIDINATSSPGVNPWTNKVSQVTATYGVYPNLNNDLMPTITSDQTVIADGTTGSVWPFQSDNAIVPPAGSIYFTSISAPAGDSIVPFISQVATYAGDSSIMIVQWGNGQPSGSLTWINTGNIVTHSGYLTNSDVLEFLRKRIKSIPI